MGDIGIEFGNGIVFTAPAWFVMLMIHHTITGIKDFRKKFKT